MIPKHVREGAVASGFDGEKAYFTIAANGKAFRTLIDGLYSNKIRAVIRELCSNAADSHIAAGQTEKFKVSIPTNLDPVFRVRDFGTALTHDQVMRLYTTIFESTKEETNEQTGQLGLGSKSPFAYTDSFQVTVWLDGVKRQYLAYLERDGVPSITHVGDSPSDEPRGLEVSFPAERGDIAQFQREMQFVSLGYAVPPEVDGMSVKVPQARISGKGWAIYPSGSFGDLRGTNFIRQGSVIYPNDQRPFPNLGYGWISVVEIPIGTADVTASRESLSYDADTIKAVSEVLAGASAELMAHIDGEVAKAKSRVDKARVYTQFNGILSNWRGSSEVSLHPDTWPQVKVPNPHYNPKYIGSQQTMMVNVDVPGTTLERAKFFGKTRNDPYYRQGSRFVYSHEYQLLDRVRVIVNEPETKIVRRNKRIQGYDTQHTFVLDCALADRKTAIAWIKECWELKDDQFILASDIPDCPPDKTQRGPSVRRVLKPGQFWMERNKGIIESDIYGDSHRGIGEYPRRMKDIAKAIGFDLQWHETFFVTTKQKESFQKRNELPESMRLDKAVQKKAAAFVKKLDLDNAITMTEVVSVVGRHNAALPVVLSNFFPGATMKFDQALEIRNTAALAEVDVTALPVYAKVQAALSTLSAQYPLLFQKSDRSHYEQYVTAVKAITPVSN